MGCVVSNWDRTDMSENSANRMRKEISDIILTGSNLNYRKWIALVAGELSTKFNNLDYISTIAILALAKIAVDPGINTNRLAIVCDMEPDEIQEHLDLLCEFRFVRDENNAFELTPLGESLYKSVGQEMLIFERSQLQRRLEVLNRIYDRLKDNTNYRLWIES
jgi:predicted transcriptional regulator